MEQLFSLEYMVSILLSGISLGGQLALIAIGYTMVYGILRLINFAHGDILMVGAYFVFFGTFAYGWPWGVAAIIAILGASVLGVVVERVAYRPLRDAPRISALISAIAVSFFIESLAVVVFTGQPRPVLQPDWLLSVWQFGDVRILKLTAFVPVMTIALVALLLYIVHHTKPGLAMRAISKDIETTRLLGVRVDNIIAFTFFIGSALAAASGIMWALRYPQVHPYMGIMPGLKAFIAAVFGGIGSIPGALLGVALLPLIPARALQVGLGIMLMAHMVWHLLAHRPGPLHSPRLWGSVSGALAGFIQAVSGLGGPAIGMYAQLAHWDKDRTRGNISLYFLGLSLPLVLMQYLAGYYTGPVLQGLIPCLLGCGAGLVISYPLARKIGEASFQRLLAIVIGLSGFSILTRALLDS